MVGAEQAYSAVGEEGVDRLKTPGEVTGGSRGWRAQACSRIMVPPTTAEHSRWSRVSQA
ncbi:hypothetical protein WKI68_44730 [Streptomyces sp. MS1.HAVA.3]|uniref:Uncharacterized protein n=1 Tax=Streptomyces caledonius TaxID=3134107 RepID=A0ABU8UEZ9_9ACTN